MSELTVLNQVDNFYTRIALHRFIIDFVVDKERTPLKHPVLALISFKDDGRKVYNLEIKAKTSDYIHFLNMCNDVMQLDNHRQILTIETKEGGESYILAQC